MDTINNVNGGFTDAFSWLHVSDIHFSGVDDEDTAHREIVILELIRDATKIANGKLRAIVCTGDIASRGGMQGVFEYERAAAFLHELHVALGEPALLVVPGNHDVQRTPDSRNSEARLLREARDPNNLVDRYLSYAGDLEVLRERFANYIGFVEGLSILDPQATQMLAFPAWTRSFATDHFQLVFAGMNSAILSNDNFDLGKLQIGFSQLRSAHHAMSESSVVIALTHHPLSWMADETLARAHLTSTCIAHLFGHLHSPRGSVSGVLGDDQLLELGAGAVHEGGRRTGEFAYSIGRLGWTDQGELEVRVWPRVWRSGAAKWVKDDVIAPKAADFGKIRIPNWAIDPKDLSIAHSDSARWREWSLATVADFGRRRTAFPLDLSIKELHDRGVVVPPAFSPPIAGSMDLLRPVDKDTVRNLTLVLGDPGSGKSIAAYGLAVEMLDAGLHPVILRASTLRTLLSPGSRHRAILDAALMPGTGWDASPALIIDGLDELSSTATPIAGLSVFLLEASDRMPVLVTCRAEEFESQISRSLGEELFSARFSVLPWSPNLDFPNYVRHLVGAGLLESTDILEAVATSPWLSSLVARPLFARMVTFVGAQLGRTIASATALYRSYFALLAEVCELSLLEREVEPGRSSGYVVSLWRDLADVCFRNHLLTDEEVNVAALKSLMLSNGRCSEPIFLAVAAYVLDARWSGKGASGQFIHYSFYEYLVADSFAATILQEDLPSVGLAALCKDDLPRRVRHFVVDLLVADKPKRVGPLLAECYLELRQGSSTKDMLTGGNLVTYLLSRAVPGAQNYLSDLLSSESNLFLRNSLQWSIAHCGSESGAWSYVRELDCSAKMRALNRGYLLYYHGDIQFESTPPYLDDNPYLPWRYTEREVSEMLTSMNYAEDVHPARQAIDIYTFLDFCAIRGHRPDTRVSIELQARLARLWLDRSLPSGLLSRLLGSAGAVLADG